MIRNLIRQNPKRSFSNLVKESAVPEKKPQLFVESEEKFAKWKEIKSRKDKLFLAKIGIAGLSLASFPILGPTGFATFTGIVSSTAVVVDGHLIMFYRKLHGNKYPEKNLVYLDIQR